MAVEFELYVQSDLYSAPDPDWLTKTVEQRFGGEWIGGGSNFIIYTEEFSVPRALTRAELLDLQALILKEEKVKATLFCEAWTEDESGETEGNIIASTEDTHADQ